MLTHSARAQTKREHYLIENFAARDVKISMSELAEIRSVMTANKMVGERYGEAGMNGLDK